MMFLGAITFIVVSVLFIVGKAESATYYIKPHGNASCAELPCVTLPDYAVESNLMANPPRMVLKYLAGIHTLVQSVCVENSTHYAMIGDSSALPQLKSVITCSGNVGFHFENVSSVQIKFMAFHSCGVLGKSFQSIFQVRHSNLEIVSSSFQHNTLISPLLLYFSKVLISNSSFTDNIADGALSEGGAFMSYGSNITFTSSNLFVNNSAQNCGGAIAARNCTIIMMSTNGQPALYTAYAGMYRIPEEGSNIFLYNKIFSDLFVGEAIYAYLCNLNISGKLVAAGNLVVSNVKDITGLNHSGIGAYTVEKKMVRQQGATLYIGNSTLNIDGLLNVTQNKGGVFVSYSTMLINGTTIISHNDGLYGSVVALYDSTVTLLGNCFVENNKAFFAGGLDLTNSTATFINVTLSVSKNTALYAGLLLDNSTMLITGISVFNKNSGSYGTAIALQQSTLTLQGNCTTEGNVGPFNGGSIGLKDSTARFIDLTLTVLRNTAIFGGGLALDNSTLLIKGASLFSTNSGFYAGAAISLQHSTLTLQGNCTIDNNTAGVGGGGISLRQSSLILTELLLTVSGNSAMIGGGFWFGHNSKLTLEQPMQIHALHNRAKRGAAIYVEDFCFSMVPFKEQVNKCFLQIQPSRQKKLVRNYSFVFSGNTASEAGNDLYGGMLDDCVLNPGSRNNALNTFQSLSLFNESLKNNSSSISSDPFSVCFCTNHSLDCSRYGEEVEVHRGQTFSVPLVAIGQGNRPVSAVIRTHFESATLSHTGLAKNQAIQQGEKRCLPLYYTVFSAADYVELTVFAEGPCRDLGGASRTIEVHLLPCPVGFQLSGGECICHPKIQPYTNTCLAERGMIVRTNNWWISTTYYNGSLEGFITYPHCPFDYCNQDTFLLNLNHPDDQCALNRSGVLCGACQRGLSLTFGGSACSKCSNRYWPVVLLVFMVGGIVLITAILLLQLNVAKGTINGLVLYANIVFINKAMFFPARDTNILTVFISWLNFDFGIATCFYDGMDMYAKVWLQFVFPAYIWVLLIIIIIGCHYSTKLSRLFGRNPVACLSTLILLSYTKLLQTIITVLAFTILQYPNGSHKAVWLYDANIAYLQGKHVPLFLVAMCVLLFLFIPYTLLLTAGQWIQAKSNWRVLRPLNSLYLRPFFDAYYAPFKPQHRYWPGGMLLLRLILLLVFSFNSSGNISYNLLVISTSVLALCNMRLLTGRVYRYWALELLEISFLFNLGLLSVSTYHVVLSEGNQAALVYTSVGLAFVQFIGIMLYHSYTQLKGSTMWKKLSRIFNTQYYNHREEEGVTADGIEMQTAPSVLPTTCVNLREPLLDN